LVGYSLFYDEALSSVLGYVAVNEMVVSNISAMKAAKWLWLILGG